MTCAKLCFYELAVPTNSTLIFSLAKILERPVPTMRTAGVVTKIIKNK